MAFLLSLYADMHAIINLHARRGILDLAYQKNPLGNLKVAILLDKVWMQATFWDGGGRLGN